MTLIQNLTPLEEAQRYFDQVAPGTPLLYSRIKSTRLVLAEAATDKAAVTHLSARVDFYIQENSRLADIIRDLQNQLFPEGPNGP